MIDMTIEQLRTKLRGKASIEGVRLSEIDWDDLDRENAGCVDCVFEGARFANVVFIGARFSRCRFVGCRFSRADLSDAEFDECVFTTPDDPTVACAHLCSAN